MQEEVLLDITTQVQSCVLIHSDLIYLEGQDSLYCWIVIVEFYSSPVQQPEINFTLSCP